MLVYGTDFDMKDIGDGIEIIDSDNMVLKNLQIDNNERVGILLEGNPDILENNDVWPTLNITLENVRITGNGARGFVEQNARTGQGPEFISPNLVEADQIGGWLKVANSVDISKIPMILENNN